MDVSTLAPRIRDILQISDLSTVSAKKVRRQLEHEMRISLDSYKSDIDEIIKQQFQQIHNETQQRQQAQQQYAQQYAQQQGQMGGIYAGVSSHSMPGLQVPGTAGFAGAIHPATTAAGKSGAGSSMSPDATPRKRGRPRKPENEKKLQRKKRAVDPNKPKRSTGLSKPMKLSEQLASFLGQKYAARTEVVKSLWRYIKEHNLQDPVDKRYIMCDDKMQAMFHSDRLFMYTMNKLLNDHFIKPTPEENAEAIILLGLPPTHPAAADSASLLPSPSSATAPTGAKAEKSPAPSDGDNTQHTGDDEEEDEEDEEDEDEDDDDNATNPPKDTQLTLDGNNSQLKMQLTPTSADPSAVSLSLPPQPSAINGSGQ